MVMGFGLGDLPRLVDSEDFVVCRVELVRERYREVDGQLPAQGLEETVERVDLVLGHSLWFLIWN